MYRKVSLNYPALPSGEPLYGHGAIPEHEQNRGNLNYGAGATLMYIWLKCQLECVGRNGLKLKHIFIPRSLSVIVQSTCSAYPLSLIIVYQSLMKQCDNCEIKGNTLLTLLHKTMNMISTGVPHSPVLVFMPYY